MRTPADFLASRIEAGEIPSAAWLVGEPGGLLGSGALGAAVVEPVRVEASAETVYDLASLTKPLITAFLSLILCRREKVSLDSPVRRFLPVFDREDKKDLTLVQLLTHTAGLRDWAPLYVHGRSVEEYIFQIGAMTPEARPGQRVLYSDLGYIVLGGVLERLGTDALDALARELILAPLGSGACFRPGEALRPRVAATETSCNYEREKAGSAAEGYAGWRQGVVRGEVHDQNAWAAGGVAGHAGLFGTARDVYVIARELASGEAELLPEEDRRQLLRIRTGSLDSPRSLAFRVNSLAGGGPDPETAAGTSLPADTVGHNGFTGTSVWIQPRSGRIHVLLTNRVHPRVRDDVDMNALRRDFHRLSSAL